MTHGQLHIWGGRNHLILTSPPHFKESRKRIGVAHIKTKRQKKGVFCFGVVNACWYCVGFVALRCLVLVCLLALARPSRREEKLLQAKAKAAEAEAARRMYEDLLQKTSKAARVYKEKLEEAAKAQADIDNTS